MPDNEVSLIVGSSKLTGWKSVSVSRSLDALADTFDFEMVDVWDGEETPLVPYSECKIEIEKTAGGARVKEKVLTGYIDGVSIDVDPGQIVIKVNGRSKTADLVDCSAEYLPSNSWKNTPLTTIIRDLLDVYGLSLDFVSSSAFGRDANLSLTINSGESVFEILDRECRKRGILPVSNPNGELELITTGDRLSRDNLVLGENVLTASVSFDYTNRFSKYKVKGQKSGGGDDWGIASTTQVSGESTDTVFGSRYRLKIITMDGEGSNKDAQNIAAWEAQVRAGKTGKLSVKLPSWFQSNNSLWEPGTLVYCSIPPLRIAEELLINEVRFSQDDSGTFSDLTLVNADTYLADPTKQTKITKKSKKEGFGYGW